MMLNLHILINQYFRSLNIFVNEGSQPQFNCILLNESMRLVLFVKREKGVFEQG